MRLILLGAPGCGKGTLAGNIVKENSYCHISTGEILRQNIALGTPVGLMAKSYIDKGHFVPDEIIIKLLKEKLATINDDNFILDGFPRNLAQAKELDTITKIDKVVYINVDYQTILKRITGRRVCGDCGKVFNTEFYDKIECDNCGGILIQRNDDKEEIVKERFEIYERQTKPLIDYYKEQNKFCTIVAGKTPLETYKNFQNLFLEEI